MAPALVPAIAQMTAVLKDASRADEDRAQVAVNLLGKSISDIVLRQPSAPEAAKFDVHAVGPIDERHVDNIEPAVRDEN